MSVLFFTVSKDLKSQSVIVGTSSKTSITKNMSTTKRLKMEI